MQYLHQNTLFCWFSLETSRIGNINLKRREICHIPLPEAHVEWDHCDPDILSGLLVYVAQLKPGVVLKSTVSSSGGWGQNVEKAYFWQNNFNSNVYFPFSAPVDSYVQNWN